jgi:hypothetical protein
MSSDSMALFHGLITLARLPRDLGLYIQCSVKLLENEPTSSLVRSLSTHRGNVRLPPAYFSPTKKLS